MLEATALTTEPQPLPSLISSFANRLEGGIAQKEAPSLHTNYGRGGSGRPPQSRSRIVKKLGWPSRSRSRIVKKSGRPSRSRSPTRPDPILSGFYPPRDISPIAGTKVNRFIKLWRSHFFIKAVIGAKEASIHATMCIVTTSLCISVILKGFPSN